MSRHFDGRVMYNRKLEIKQCEFWILIPFFSVPFSKPIVTLGLIMSSIIVIRQLWGNRINRLTVIDSVNWYLPVLLIYYGISTAISGGNWGLVERRLTFVIVPVLFALGAVFANTDLRKQAFISFVAGNAVASFICFGRALFRSICRVEGKLVFDASVVKEENFDFLTSSLMGGNYFFGSEFSYFIDSTYFALFIVVAQLLCYLLFLNTDSIRRRIFLVVAFVYFSLLVFLLSSKAAMLSSVALTLFIVVSIKTSARVKFVVVLLSCLFSVSFLLMNPRLKYFFDTASHSLIKIDPEARFGHSLRILSWDASLDVIKDNFLLGVGEGQKELSLNRVYARKGYIVPARENFNSHNLYLDFLLGGGIIGLAIFLVGLVWFARVGIKNKDRFILLFLAIVAFAAMFENLFSRFSGSIFFAVFISLLTITRSASERRPEAK